MHPPFAIAWKFSSFVSACLIDTNQKKRLCGFRKKLKKIFGALISYHPVAGARVVVFAVYSHAQELFPSLRKLSAVHSILLSAWLCSHCTHTRRSFFLTSKIGCEAHNFVKRVFVFAVQLYALIISHSFVVYNIKIKNIFRIPHFRFFLKKIKIRYWQTLSLVL